ncbi:MAG: alanine racemase [Phycisphaerae bacterium]
MELCYLQAQIDRSAIEHNCRLLKSRASGCRFCVAIKADAYGHGVKVVLPAMDRAGVDMLAVACIEEASELRLLGWKGPILVFGNEFGIYSEKQRQEIAEFLVENHIRITVTRKQDAEILGLAGEKLNKLVVVHLALDTGMSRMGLSGEDLWELIEQLGRLPQIQIEGLYTHFATADCVEKSFAKLQLSRFNEFLLKLKRSGIAIPIIHAANSGACVDLPEAHFNMVRPGISVYGYHASGEMHCKPGLRPALKLISFFTLVKTIPAGSCVGYGCTFQAKRETTVGLVPIGYADGYFRELSNRGKMIVAEKIVPVIGRVSMDQTILDLTDLTAAKINPQVGDEAVIYDNHRESPNSVEKTAELLGTIPYVVTTSLGNRVKRIGIDS